MDVLGKVSGARLLVVLVFEVHRGLITERAVDPHAVVSNFNGFEDGLASFFTIGKNGGASGSPGSLRANCSNGLSGSPGSDRLGDWGRPAYN